MPCQLYLLRKLPLKPHSQLRRRGLDWKSAQRARLSAFSWRPKAAEEADAKREEALARAAAALERAERASEQAEGAGAAQSSSSTVSAPPLLSQSAAVVRVQAQARGHLARQQSREHRRAQAEESTRNDPYSVARERLAAATLVQAKVRGHLARQHSWERTRERAAVTLQARLRGNAARKATNEHRRLKVPPVLSVERARSYSVAIQPGPDDGMEEDPDSPFAQGTHDFFEKERARGISVGISASDAARTSGIFDPLRRLETADERSEPSDDESSSSTVSAPPLLSQSAAVVRVQAQARGHLARQQSREHRRAQAEESTRNDPYSVARERLAAATLVQAKVRGHLARQHSRHHRTSRAEQATEQAEVAESVPHGNSAPPADVQPAPTRVALAEGRAQIEESTRNDPYSAAEPALEASGEPDKEAPATADAAVADALAAQPDTSEAPGEEAPATADAVVADALAAQPDTSEAPGEEAPATADAVVADALAAQPDTSEAPGEEAPATADAAVADALAAQPDTSEAPGEEAPATADAAVADALAAQPDTSGAPGEEAPAAADAAVADALAAQPDTSGAPGEEAPAAADAAVADALPAQEADAASSLQPAASQGADSEPALPPELFLRDATLILRTSDDGNRLAACTLEYSQNDGNTFRLPTRVAEDNDSDPTYTDMNEPPNEVTEASEAKEEVNGTGAQAAAAVTRIQACARRNRARRAVLLKAPKSLPLKLVHFTFKALDGKSLNAGNAMLASCSLAYTQSDGAMIAMPSFEESWKKHMDARRHLLPPGGRKARIEHLQQSRPLRLICRLQAQYRMQATRRAYRPSGWAGHLRTACCALSALHAPPRFIRARARMPARRGYEERRRARLETGALLRPQASSGSSCICPAARSVSKADKAGKLTGLPAARHCVSAKAQQLPSRRGIQGGRSSLRFRARCSRSVARGLGQ